MNTWMQLSSIDSGMVENSIREKIKTTWEGTTTELINDLGLDVSPEVMSRALVRVSSSLTEAGWTLMKWRQGGTGARKLAMVPPGHDVPHTSRRKMIMPTFGAWLGEQAGRPDDIGKLGQFWKDETGHGKIRSVAGIMGYLSDGPHKESWPTVQPILDAAVAEFRRTGGLTVVQGGDGGPPGRTIEQEAARRQEQQALAAAENGRAERMSEIHAQLGITPGEQAAGEAGQRAETAAERWEREHGRALMPVVDPGSAVAAGIAAGQAASGEMPINPEAEARRALALRSVATEPQTQVQRPTETQMELPGVLELSGAALEGGTEPGTLALWTGDAWVTVGAAAAELLTAVRAVTRAGRVRPVAELDREAAADPERERYLARVAASGEGSVLPASYMPEVFHYDLATLWAAADHTAGIVD